MMTLGSNDDARVISICVQQQQQHASVAAAYAGSISADDARMLVWQQQR